MVAALNLIFWSFCASLGFALLFRIVGYNLLLAALGGAFSRAVLLTAMHFTGQRALYMLIAAMFASCFAKYIALRFRQPTNILLYPTIIPLIPADLLYNMMMALVTGDTRTAYTNGFNLFLALLGLCVGFVLVSAFTYCVRRRRAARDAAKTDV